MFDRKVVKNTASADEETVAAMWDQNASAWVTLVRAGRDVLREILINPLFFGTFLPDLSGLDVLDLGCGEGLNTRLLAKRGARMTGVDLSPRLIEAALSCEAASPLGVKYSVCSFTSLDGFADASFDAAVSTMALMNSPDLSGAARAVFRILRPRGRFFFSVLHPCFWTRASRWVKEADGREHGMLVTDYWLDEPYVEEFRFDGVSAAEAPPFVVTRFPYRLEDYINCLAHVGFRITGVLEPRPTVEMAAAYPTLLGPLRKHAPIVLYLGAAKT